MTAHFMMEMDAISDSGLEFNQLRAFTAFKRGRSVALLGGAGSGKSFFLECILREGKKQHGSDSVIACTWTDSVAFCASGVTVHSLFGLRTGFHVEENELWNQTKKNPILCRYLAKVKVIVIDEISAFKAHVLDAIDFVMSKISENERSACLPMRSRQLVVAGDPFQLEPIGVANDNDDTGPVFFSKTWLSVFGSLRSGVVALLKGNHRHEVDCVFREILTRMRTGYCTDTDIADINATGFKTTNNPYSHTALYQSRNLVQHRIDSALHDIPGQTFTSRSAETYCRNRTAELEICLSQAAPKYVIVKLGCEMLLTRKIGVLIPGTRFTVRSVIHDSDNPNILSLTIEAEDVDHVIRVNPLRFEVFGPHGSVLCHRMQLPVVSAYALTLQKCRGLSLNKVYIDFRDGTEWKQAGMVYFALSRCRSLKGLRVRGLEKKHMVISEKYLAFMKDIAKLKSYFCHRVIGSVEKTKNDRQNEKQKHQTSKKRKIKSGEASSTFERKSPKF